MLKTACIVLSREKTSAKRPVRKFPDFQCSFPFSPPFNSSLKFNDSASISVLPLSLCYWPLAEPRRPSVGVMPMISLLLISYPPSLPPHGCQWNCLKNADLILSFFRTVLMCQMLGKLKHDKEVTFAPEELTVKWDTCKSSDLQHQLTCTTSEQGTSLC